MQVVEIDEMVSKIKAAKDQQRDPDFYVIARTDAVGAGLGKEATLERMNAYADAGADSIQVISRSLEMLNDIGQAWDQRIPLTTAPTRFAHISADELYDSGYTIIFYTEVLSRAAIFAMDRALDALARDHSAKALENEMVPTETLYEIVKLPEWREYENKYVPFHMDKDK